MAESSLVPADFSAAEGLDSLLSAASYLFPETSSQQSTQTADRCQLSYDESDENTLESGPPTGHRSTNPGSQAPNLADPPTRKRGRPRKSEGNPSSQDPDERRRDQVRRAQQAFRNRQEASSAKDKAQIQQLEAAINEMNSIIVSFGDDLTKSGLLTSDPSLQSRLRHVLVRSQDLAKTNIPAFNDDRHGSSPTQRAARIPKQRLLPYSLTPMYMAQPTTSPRISIDLAGFPMPLCPGSPFLFDTNDTALVEIPLFVRQLRRAFTYHGYFSLRDPLVNLNDLRRKFRFLFSMLSRERLTSYFEAAVQAEVSPLRMDEWKEIPLLSVGGSGTHYPKPSPPSNTSFAGTTSRTHPRSPVPGRPVYEVPLQSQGQSDPSWFDIRDLEGFLRAKNVYLLTNADMDVQRPLSRQNTINPSKLIRTLIGSCICLGRSPGWRPMVVEQALHTAMWDTVESQS